MNPNKVWGYLQHNNIIFDQIVTGKIALLAMYGAVLTMRRNVWGNKDDVT